MEREAGEEATAVMSRLQALEKRSTSAMTSCTEPQTWSGERSSEAFKMDFQNWVGSLHDNMMKVMEQG